jgi:hypothetical protein
MCYNGSVREKIGLLVMIEYKFPDSVIPKYDLFGEIDVFGFFTNDINPQLYDAIEEGEEIFFIDKYGRAFVNGREITLFINIGFS